jgi:hypothetical protein
MPGFLLHEDAEVLCAHMGQAKPMVPSVRVQVSSMHIVTQTSPYTITNCALPPPPTANGPCVTALWTVAATRVFVEGQPVLLQDSQATCAPTGTPLIITTTQLRVKGM